MILQQKPISGFQENSCSMQIVENNFKEIIRKNYELAGFTPLETPAVERLETLLSKGGDDKEIYGLYRLAGDKIEETGFGLHFDLTIPFARFVAQNEGNLVFPFKRYQVQKSWRGERPQKCRFREFYQADIDVVGNGNLPLLADVEIIYTISKTLKDLDFGDFTINLNNKKILVGFLESLDIKNIVETISIIDKKDKVKDITMLLESINLKKNQIYKIQEFIDFSENNNSDKIIIYLKNLENNTLKEGVEELNYIYTNLLKLGINKNYIKINPAISRGLNYYTGSVFETFINGYENIGSISSGGRYENLCSSFTKNSYPGVGGSIGLTRLLCVLESIGKVKQEKETITNLLILNLDNSLLDYYLDLTLFFRNKAINTEFYLDSSKMQKQLKYADMKKIPYVLIIGQEEKDKKIISFKNLITGEQESFSEKNLDKIAKKIREI